MSRHFGLYLGDEQIPVINWINRHGPPEGRDLRFTVPLAAKSKLESNASGSFTLKRGDESWDFELLSLDLHSTGTNGVRAIGRVKVPRKKLSLAELSSAAKAKKSGTGVGIPSLDGSPSEASASSSSSASLEKLEKLKQKAKREKTSTEHGSPASEPREADAEEPAAPPAPETASEEE